MEGTRIRGLPATAHPMIAEPRRWIEARTATSWWRRNVAHSGVQEPQDQRHSPPDPPTRDAEATTMHRALIARHTVVVIARLSPTPGRRRADRATRQR